MRESKTAAGVRRVDLLPALRDELARYRPLDANPESRVFTTAAGSPRDKDNIARRVIAPTVKRADELLTARDEAPLPEGITAHKLRHTFASLLAACGEDPAYVMAQLGHADARFTLRVYTHAMSRRDGERDRLRALVEGADWQQRAARALRRLPSPTGTRPLKRQNPPPCRGFRKWALLGSNQ